MSVVAITPDYEAPVRDREENFHGNRVVYFHWEDHLMFCAAIAFPLPPDMPFGAVLGEILPEHYGMHPDWEKVDLSKAKWTVDGKELTPDPDKSLADHGVKHKSLIRFWTPGLEGYEGSKS